MSDFAALGSAIRSQLGTALGVGVYYALKPQGTGTYPIVVFQRMDSVDGYTFGGTAGQEVSTDYMVKIIGQEMGPTELYALYGSVHSRLQGAALTVTGWSALRCERRTTVEYRDADGYWHVGGIYRIDLDQ